MVWAWEPVPALKPLAASKQSADTATSMKDIIMPTQFHILAPLLEAEGVGRLVFFVFFQCVSF